MDKPESEGLIKENKESKAHRFGIAASTISLAASIVFEKTSPSLLSENVYLNFFLNLAIFIGETLFIGFGAFFALGVPYIIVLYLYSLQIHDKKEASPALYWIYSILALLIIPFMLFVYWLQY